MTAAALTAIQAAREGVDRVTTRTVAQSPSQLDRLHADLVASADLLYAFDAAFPAPGAVYKAHGGIAANVYVSGNFAQSAAHVAALRADGIAPWPGYEVALWELVSNRAAGQNAARRAIADALHCGFPADGTIWFQYSVDVNVDPTRYHEVGDAFRGIRDVDAGRFLPSFYGQGDLARYLRANRIIDQKCWLSASSSFPGWNPSSPDICIWQQVGNFIPGYSTDRNVITDVSALHAWWPVGSPYATGGQSMSQTDIDAINAHTDARFAALAQQIGEATHPKTDSLRNVMLSAIADLKAVIQAVTGVQLTDAQVAQIGAAAAKAMPPPVPMTITGTAVPSS